MAPSISSSLRVEASETVLVVPSASSITAVSALSTWMAAPAVLVIVAPFRMIRTYPSVSTTTCPVVDPLNT